jgi:hypothetical protein
VWRISAGDNTSTQSPGRRFAVTGIIVILYS